MSAPSRGTPARAPRARLETLNNSTRLSTPRIGRAPPKTTPQCENPSCTRSDVIEEDGKLICRSCGFVLSDVQITQELTFGEAANGAAVVQGVYIGANEENARNTGLGPSKLTGGMDSRQVTERNGQHHISNLVAALRLSTTQKERAYLMWTLAMNQNFIQGRVTRHVAAVCLYIACRNDKECRLMLVDFSDLLEMNVFKLGQIYTSFVEALNLNDRHISIGLVNPENLIHRFAQDLEFGPDEHKIANEAVQVLKRLDRDWITTGRRPAGVCAAALILAARMNNYRRTVREVIYTAKVCEITISKRLDEFRYTESSRLTVEEFRHHGENLAAVHDPPAFYQQFETQKGRRSKKVDATQEVINAEAAQPPSSSADGNDGAMGPPPLPQPTPLNLALISDVTEEHLTALAQAEGTDAQAQEDSAEESASVAGQKRKRGPGRPKGAKNNPLPQLSAADLDDEAILEREVEFYLKRPDIEQQAAATHQLLSSESRASNPTASPERAAPAPSIEIPHEPAVRPAVRDSEYISDSEFPDDPDIKHALLSEAEIAIKEKIWVHENVDWLKALQARQLKHELAASAGTVRVPKKRTRKKKPRIGDTTHYPSQRDENGNLVVAGSPAESVKMMLSHRGYSKKLDYATVEKLYRQVPSRSPSTAAVTASERRSTRAPSEASEQEDYSTTAPSEFHHSRARAGPAAAPAFSSNPQIPQGDPIVIEDGDDESSDEESDDDEFLEE